jgi:hypothetical protein
METQTGPGVIETRTAQLWLGEDGIIRKVFLPNARETLADALESEEVIRQISAGKKRPILVDFTALRGMDPDARDYYISERAGSLLTACGGITKSMIGRVISNFFIGFNKPPTPVKLFNNEEQSIEWLKQFTHNEQ